MANTKSKSKLLETSSSNKESKEYVLDIFKRMFEAYSKKFKERMNLTDSQIADKFSDNILPGFFDFAIEAEHAFGTDAIVDVSNYLSLKHACWLNSLDFVNKYPYGDKALLAYGFVVHKDDLAKVEKDLDNNSIPVNIDLIPHAFISAPSNTIFDPTLGDNQEYHYFYKLVPEEIWKSFKYYYKDSRTWWVNDFSDWAHAKIRDSKESKKFYDFVNINEDEVLNTNTDLQVRNEKGVLVNAQEVSNVSSEQERDEHGVLLPVKESVLEEKDLTVSSDMEKTIPDYKDNGWLNNPDKWSDIKLKTTDDAEYENELDDMINIQDTLYSKHDNIHGYKTFVDNLLIKYKTKIEEVFAHAINTLKPSQTEIFSLQGIGVLNESADTYYSQNIGIKTNYSKDAMGFADEIPFYTTYLRVPLDKTVQHLLIVSQDKPVYQYRYQKLNCSIVNIATPVSSEDKSKHIQHIVLKDIEGNKGDVLPTKLSIYEALVGNSLNDPFMNLKPFVHTKLGVYGLNKLGNKAYFISFEDDAQDTFNSFGFEKIINDKDVNNKFLLDNKAINIYKWDNGNLTNLTNIVKLNSTEEEVKENIKYVLTSTDLVFTSGNIKLPDNKFKEIYSDKGVNYYSTVDFRGSVKLVADKEFIEDKKAFEILKDVDSNKDILGIAKIEAKGNSFNFVLSQQYKIEEDEKLKNAEIHTSAIHPEDLKACVKTVSDEKFWEWYNREWESQKSRSEYNPMLKRDNATLDVETVISPFYTSIIVETDSNVNNVFNEDTVKELTERLMKHYKVSLNIKVKKAIARTAGDKPIQTRPNHQYKGSEITVNQITGDVEATGWKGVVTLENASNLQPVDIFNLPLGYSNEVFVGLEKAFAIDSGLQELNKKVDLIENLKADYKNAQIEKLNKSENNLIETLNKDSNLTENIRYMEYFPDLSFEVFRDQGKNNLVSDTKRTGNQDYSNRCFFEIVKDASGEFIGPQGDRYSKTGNIVVFILNEDTTYNIVKQEDFINGQRTLLETISKSFSNGTSRSLIDIANVLKFGFYNRCYDSVKREWIYVDNKENITNKLALMAFNSTLDKNSILVSLLNKDYILPESFLPRGSTVLDLNNLLDSLTECNNIMSNLYEEYSGSEYGKNLEADSNPEDYSKSLDLFNNKENEFRKEISKKQGWLEFTSKLNLLILPNILTDEIEEIRAASRDTLKLFRSPRLTTKMKEVCDKLFKIPFDFTTKLILFSAIRSKRSLQNISFNANECFNYFYKNLNGESESTPEILGGALVLNSVGISNTEKADLTSTDANGKTKVNVIQMAAPKDVVKDLVFSIDKIKESPEFSFFKDLIYSQIKDEQIDKYFNQLSEVFHITDDKGNLITLENIKSGEYSNSEQENLIKAFHNTIRGLIQVYKDKKNERLVKFEKALSKGLGHVNLKEYNNYYKTKVKDKFNEILSYIRSWTKEDFGDLKEGELQEIEDAIKTFSNGSGNTEKKEFSMSKILELCDRLGDKANWFKNTLNEITDLLSHKDTVFRNAMANQKIDVNALTVDIAIDKLLDTKVNEENKKYYAQFLNEKLVYEKDTIVKDFFFKFNDIVECYLNFKNKGVSKEDIEKVSQFLHLTLNTAGNFTENKDYTQEQLANLYDNAFFKLKIAKENEKNLSLSDDIKILYNNYKDYILANALEIYTGQILPLDIEGDEDKEEKKIKKISHDHYKELLNKLHSVGYDKKEDLYLYRTKQIQSTWNLSMFDSFKEPTVEVPTEEKEDKNIYVFEEISKGDNQGKEHSVDNIKEWLDSYVIDKEKDLPENANKSQILLDFFKSFKDKKKYYLLNGFVAFNLSQIKDFLNVLFTKTLEEAESYYLKMVRLQKLSSKVNSFVKYKDHKFYSDIFYEPENEFKKSFEYDTLLKWKQDKDNTGIADKKDVDNILQERAFHKEDELTNVDYWKENLNLYNGREVKDNRLNVRTLILEPFIKKLNEDSNKNNVLLSSKVQIGNLIEDIFQKYVSQKIKPLNAKLYTNAVAIKDNSVYLGDYDKETNKIKLNDKEVSNLIVNDELRVIRKSDSGQEFNVGNLENNVFIKDDKRIAFLSKTFEGWKFKDDSDKEELKKTLGFTDKNVKGFIYNINYNLLGVIDAEGNNIEFNFPSELYISKLVDNFYLKEKPQFDSLEVKSDEEKPQNLEKEPEVQENPEEQEVSLNTDYDFSDFEA